jgi:hypothetical protein
VTVFISQPDVPPPMLAVVATDISVRPGGQSGATLLASRNNIITTVALNNACRCSRSSGECRASSIAAPIRC